MAITVKPLDAPLGAEIIGLDARNITPEDSKTIFDAFLKHHILVLHDQHLTDAELESLTEHFSRTTITTDGTATEYALPSNFRSLISVEYTDGDDGVPGLSKIPLIGNLFSSKNRKRVKTNLMVFIRPTILRSEADARALADRKSVV